MASGREGDGVGEGNGAAGGAGRRFVNRTRDYDAVAVYDRDARYHARAGKAGAGRDSDREARYRDRLALEVGGKPAERLVADVNRDVLRGNFVGLADGGYRTCVDGRDVAVEPRSGGAARSDAVAVGLAHKVDVGHLVDVEVNRARGRVGTDEVNFVVHVYRVSFDDEKTVGEDRRVVLAVRGEHRRVADAAHDGHHIGDVGGRSRADLAPTDAVELEVLGRAGGKPETGDADIDIADVLALRRTRVKRRSRRGDRAERQRGVDGVGRARDRERAGDRRAGVDRNDLEADYLSGVRAARVGLDVARYRKGHRLSRTEGEGVADIDLVVGVERLRGADLEAVGIQEDDTAEVRVNAEPGALHRDAVDRHRGRTVVRQGEFGERNARGAHDGERVGRLRVCADGYLAARGARARAGSCARTRARAGTRAGAAAYSCDSCARGRTDNADGTDAVSGLELDDRRLGEAAEVGGLIARGARAGDRNLRRCGAVEEHLERLDIRAVAALLERAGECGASAAGAGTSGARSRLAVKSRGDVCDRRCISAERREERSD